MQHAQGFMRRIGKVMRATNEDLTHEPLPERWVDLIHYLDDKERRERTWQGQKLARPRSS